MLNQCFLVALSNGITDCGEEICTNLSILKEIKFDCTFFRRNLSVFNFSSHKDLKSVEMYFYFLCFHMLEMIDVHLSINVVF